MTQWSSPNFIEIKMDAEISSYQEDGDPRRDPNFARQPAPAATEAESRLSDD